MIESWKKEIKENNSFNALKKFIIAFRCACHVGDTDKENINYPYHISTSKVFTKLMKFCILNMNELFRIFLNEKNKKLIYKIS